MRLQHDPGWKSILRGRFIQNEILVRCHWRATPRAARSTSPRGLGQCRGPTPNALFAQSLLKNSALNLFTFSAINGAGKTLQYNSLTQSHSRPLCGQQMGVSKDSKFGEEFFNRNRHIFYVRSGPFHDGIAAPIFHKSSHPVKQPLNYGSIKLARYPYEAFRCRHDLPLGDGNPDIGYRLRPW